MAAAAVANEEGMKAATPTHEREGEEDGALQRKKKVPAAVMKRQNAVGKKAQKLPRIVYNPLQKYMFWCYQVLA